MVECPEERESSGTTRRESVALLEFEGGLLSKVHSLNSLLDSPESSKFRFHGESLRELLKSMQYAPSITAPVIQDIVTQYINHIVQYVTHNSGISLPSPTTHEKRSLVNFVGPDICEHILSFVDPSSCGNLLLVCKTFNNPRKPLHTTISSEFGHLDLQLSSSKLTLTELLSFDLAVDDGFDFEALSQNIQKIPALKKFSCKD
jgi:hypothetical protein